MLLNSGEAGFRLAISERATSMVATEGRNGQSILRPEQHHLGHFGGGKGREQLHLEHFFSRAEPRPEDVDIYAADRSATTLVGAIERYFNDLSTKFEVEPG